MRRILFRTGPGLLVLLLALTLVLSPAAAQSGGAASGQRTLPADPVCAEAEFDVVMSASGWTIFGQVIETLPAGFQYVSTTLPPTVGVEVVGQDVKFTFIGAAPPSFTYTVKASDVIGSHYFNGVALDDNKNSQTITGGTEVIVADCSRVDIDFGDAPDPTYPTLLANNGASHVIVPNLFLGKSVDGELDGQPTVNADGDDINPVTPDDEDGVTFTSPIVPGQMATVDVEASAPGFLNAWIDFNSNGNWLDPGEQIFAALPLGPGINNLSFSVPPTTVVGVTTYARFRFSSMPVLGFDGPAIDGEVEDYPTAPVPELPTVLLMALGVLGVAGMVLWRRRESPAGC